MDIIVNNKLTNDTYEKLKNLENLFFEFGEITYFSKKDIDHGQKGFRCNFYDDTINDEWAGDEYVIIGYDTTRGIGPDPIIIKVDEESLPIYYLHTDGGDWKNPIKIADTFDNYIKIMNCISKFSKDLEYSTLNILDYYSLIEDISNINSKKNIDYWEELLNNSILKSNL